MKKKIIKIGVLSSLTALSILGHGGNASATTHSANSSGKSFNKAWSSLIINDANRTFKIGYNTTLINEDITHTYHKTVGHTAYVKNPGVALSKPAAKGNYAKAEVRHHGGGTVYYSFSY